MSGILETQHNFIVGQTQSGKTYFTLKQLEKSNLPVFFFNPQAIDNNFIDADRYSQLLDIHRALKRGMKINYVPSMNLKYSRVELNYIIQGMFQFREAENYKNPFYFAIDECHLVAKESGNNEYVNMIPTRGYAWGFRGIFITQRPALTDKTLITQSDKHIIFHTEWEKDYFKSKGINIDNVNELLGNSEADKHNYVIYTRGQLNGPFKE